MSLLTVDHDLRGPRARVVIRAHDEAVGARRHNRQQGARRNRKLAILCEKIRRLAHGTDHVVALRRRPLLNSHLAHIVPAAIKSGADEIIHRRVDNGEMLGAVSFQVQDPGEEDSGVSDNRPPGLDEKLEFSTIESFMNSRGVFGRRRRRFILVTDP